MCSQGRLTCRLSQALPSQPVAAGRLRPLSQFSASLRRLTHMGPVHALPAACDRYSYFLGTDQTYSVGGGNAGFVSVHVQLAILGRLHPHRTTWAPTLGILVPVSLRTPCLHAPVPLSCLPCRPSVVPPAACSPADARVACSCFTLAPLLTFYMHVTVLSPLLRCRRFVAPHVASRSFLS